MAVDSGSSDGDLAAEFSSAYGLKPDRWQGIVLGDWLRWRSGQWAALTCGLAVPRQNGKNALLEMRELYGMVGLGERILHTAHEVKTAQKHFRRLKYFFGSRRDDPAAQFPELNALVDSVRSVNGQEAIFLRSGGSIEIVARSKNSGRGFTVDTLVFDEAQELAEDELEALMPTTSAAPLGNPQWIFTGTPPGPLANGEVFFRVRAEARDDRASRLAWHEWSIRFDQSDLDDRTVWRMTNPGLDSGRLQLDVIEGERARFSDEGFARERLGYWESDSGRGPLDGLWPDLEIAEVDEPGVDAPRAYGVAFSPKGDRIALGVAALGDESVHVVQLPLPEDIVRFGLAPLADFLCAKVDGVPRWRRASQIVVSGRAGAGLLERFLVERGVPRRRIKLPSTGEYMQSCSMLLDRARAGSLTHLGDGQEALAESARSAVQKERAGGWGWDSPTDETPVEAVSLALFGVVSKKRGESRNAGKVMVMQ